MDELLDEADDDFFAEWDTAEQAALNELKDILADVGERPRPDAELHAACQGLRTALTRGEWPAGLLGAGGGVDPNNLDSDDGQLWLQLAAGVVSPMAEPPEDIPVDLLTSTALDHEEWLEAVAALARGGPGTPASAGDLARFVADADGEDDDDEDDIDVLQGWFMTVVEQWHLLGAVDDDERLTPLGWWGIPEALLQVWSHDSNDTA